MLQFIFESSQPCRDLLALLHFVRVIFLEHSASDIVNGACLFVLVSIDAFLSICMSGIPGSQAISLLQRSTRTMLSPQFGIALGGVRSLVSL